jgi:hypothetical protein
MGEDLADGPTAIAGISEGRRQVEGDDDQRCKRSYCL